MVQMLLLIVLSGGFFSSSSVSFAERADAIWSNPAGRAMHFEGVEFQSGLQLLDSTPSYRFGLALASWGVGYRSGDSSGTWTLGLGVPLGKRFRIGGAYYWGEGKRWSFGLQSNPLNWLAIGAMLQTGDTLGATVGLGVRPFTDRITIFSDVSYRDGFENLRAGIGVEPLPGLSVSGSAVQPLDGNGSFSWSAGAEFAFSYVKLGASYDSDGSVGINLGLSVPRYPSIRLSKPGPKVVVWEPKGRPEAPESRGFNFTAVSLSFKKSKTFYDLLTELRALGERKDVKGLLLDFRQAGLSGYQMEEVRSELTKLKEKGIKIVAFAEGYSLGSYWLACVADLVWMVPTGEISLIGGYARTLHLKGALDKLGIEPEFYRVGEYKSAYELFEFSETSKEDKEQLAAYLSTIYDLMLGAISRDRGISRSEFEGYMNERIMISGDTALSLGLVDRLCQALELDSLLKEEFGARLEQVKFADLSKEPSEIPRAWVTSENQDGANRKGKIAIVVAEGSIVTGKSSSNPMPIPLLGGKQMGSTTISELLARLKKDKQVKAVVFRICSGGGSALASEIINRALADLASVKPVIVSMGDLAGSGGYYIAAPAAKIYADASTVTGSIGILGGKFVTKGLNEKLGITRETIKLYPHCDIFSPDRPFDEKEAALMQRIMDQGYAEFVSRVAEGRNMSFDDVDSVARGRIWSGSDGVRVGLVDEIGGIMAAVDEARKQAGLPDDCGVSIYPKPEPVVDLKKILDEELSLNLKLLPSWLYENLLYLVPYEVEFSIE